MTSTVPDPFGVLGFPDDPDAALYRRLLRDAPTSKRTPVWLHPNAEQRFGFMELPNDRTRDLDAADPHAVLSEWWPGPCPPACTCLEPFPDGFPGLVRVGEGDRSQLTSTIEEATAFADTAGPWSMLALVDAARPADIPAATAWGGVGNYWHQDLVGLCAVLRSWEERFGAVLVHMEQDTLLLTVADPPVTQDESERVAAEHFAFCPDQNDPQNGTVYTPRSYAETITGAKQWRFWWD